MIWLLSWRAKSKNYYWATPTGLDDNYTQWHLDDSYTHLGDGYTHLVGVVVIDHYNYDKFCGIDLAMNILDW